MSKIQDEHDDDIELYEEAASSRKHADHVGNIRTMGFAKAMQLQKEENEFYRQVELERGAGYANSQRKFWRQVRAYERRERQGGWTEDE